MWKIIKIFGGQKKNGEMLWWSDAIEMLLWREGGGKLEVFFQSKNKHKHCIDWKMRGGQRFPGRPSPPYPLQADKSAVGIWQRESHLESDHRVWEELKAEIFVGYVRGSCPGGLILLTERGGGAAGVGTMVVLMLMLMVRETGQVGDPKWGAKQRCVDLNEKRPP